MKNRVVKRSAPEDDSVIYCPQCGKGSPETERYCKSCGAHMILGSQQVQPNYGMAAGAAHTGPARSPRLSKGSIVGLLVLGIVALGVAITVGLLIVGNTVNTIKSQLKLSSNPPAFVKDLSVLKSGTKAFDISFALADQSGTLTTWNGTAVLTIYEDPINATDQSANPAIIYSHTYPVSAAGFRHNTTGEGASAHETLLFHIERLEYTAFDIQPSSPTGSAHLTFQPIAGPAVTGETTITFDK